MGSKPPSSSPKKASMVTTRAPGFRRSASSARADTVSVSGCRHKVAIQTMSACHPKSVLKKSAARNSTAAERPARPRAPARARAASAAPCRASTSSRPRQSRSSGKATAEHRAPSAAAQVHEHLPGLRGDSPR
ncbi:unnamed protein product [Prorocentrum cordatum]|uniref:Uncharacterized protein n=1 Tax=Prorocentrum cordatum TaxID=2364126 RepID=A0ABN9X739_9DINO|nr:unnamed protein product [Polarella glacialis]